LNDSTVLVDGRVSRVRKNAGVVYRRPVARPQTCRDRRSGRSKTAEGGLPARPQTCRDRRSGRSKAAGALLCCVARFVGLVPRPMSSAPDSRLRVLRPQADSRRWRVCRRCVGRESTFQPRAVLLDVVPLPTISRCRRDP